MQNGETPSDIAKKNGHDSLVEELKSHTASQPVDSQPMMIPFKDLEFVEIVGSGACGVVRKGYWTFSDGKST